MQQKVEDEKTMKLQEEMMNLELRMYISNSNRNASGMTGSGEFDYER